MKTINNYNLRGKIILLRADVNSDVINGKAVMSERIEQTAESVKALKKKGARVVIIGHQGRPGGDDFTSLKEHAKLLSKYTKVRFVGDIIGEKAEREIKNLKNGEAVLLDNIRQLDDEFKPGKNKFVVKLSSWCDYYCNDAFSNSHRKHSSMISFPKYMKSFAGPLLKKEIDALKKINVKNSVYILAGAKPLDNIKLMGKGHRVLACGLFGQMCLISQGKNLGAQNKFLMKKFGKDYDDILKKLKPLVKKGNVLMPVDFAVQVSGGKRKELNLEDFPSKFEIFDIGKKTQKIYIDEIRKAKGIYMKGTAGSCEFKEFCDGSQALFNAIAKSKGFSLLGGGNTTSALKRMKISYKKFGHISLSGGALLCYISGEKLVGLDALEKGMK